MEKQNAAWNRCSETLFSKLFGPMIQLRCDKSWSQSFRPYEKRVNSIFLWNPSPKLNRNWTRETFASDFWSLACRAPICLYFSKAKILQVKSAFFEIEDEDIQKFLYIRSHSENCFSNFFYYDLDGATRNFDPFHWNAPCMLWLNVFLNCQSKQ